MNFIIGLFVFFLGAIIGSFLNVCIYRMPKEESIAFPPSHCGNCGHNLKVLDLVPIFSLLFLKGRCRYCKEKVSMQYPFVEGLTGVLFVFLYLKYGFMLDTIKYCIFTALLIVIGMIDFKTQDVYDSTIITTAIVGIGFLIIEYFLGKTPSLLGIFIGIVVPAGILAIFAFVGAMGWGDVEIIAVTGLFLIGKLNIFNLFLSIIIGGMVAIIFMALKKKEKGSMMAFGPYISIASFITLLFGNEIINFYISTFMR